MTTDIVLPTDQTEGTSNTVGKWHKAVGERVELDEPLLEIITDKVTVEIAAPAAGVLVEIRKPEGDTVEPGEILGRIGAAAGAGTPSRVSPASPAPAPSVKSVKSVDPSSSDDLSPAVRRLLKEHGLDASAVAGTGRGGRITVQDVEAFLSRRAGAPSRLVPHSPMRKSIAQHMTASVQAAPHVTTVFEVDLSAVIAHRTAHKEEFVAHGVNLTYTAYFVRAAVDALRAVPEVNSRWHDDALELFEDHNIGVATALGGGGLIVPVIHQAQDLDLLGLARRLQDLVTRARDGKLEPREVRGGTFTISNHGVSGSLVAAPIIINQPQSAILGIGKMESRPVVTRAERIEARPMAYVTLTIDHRVLDAFQANAFLTKWVDSIETWS